MERLTNSGTKEVRPDVTISDVIKKLTEYEDLEEQGKLLKLPCTVGDKVYRVNKAALQALKEKEGSNEKKRNVNIHPISPEYECQLRFCPEPEHGSHYSKEGLVNTVELAIDWGLPVSYDALCEYIKIVSER